MKSMNIVVLAGGTSTEREVSLITGKGVYEALKSKGHKVVLIDVYLGVENVDVDKVFDDTRDWAAGIEAIAANEPDIEKFKALRKDGGKCFFGPNVIEICQKADVVFMGLHGANGEDGRIQATLDLYGIPYTGTDYISSAICMDKGITKKFFNMAGIPNAKGYDMNLDEDFKEIGYPVVVKVSTGGSSVGTYICKDRAEVDHALNEAKKFDDKVVVEEFIKGREFTCGVVDGKALPIVEIAPKVGFYDFANKYQAGQTNDICPAVLPEDKTLEIQRTAEEAYKVLKIKNYARIDFMMNEKGDIFCLEANTLPGMTPTSLLPMEAAAVGIDYPSLCEKLIEISLRNK